MFDKEQAKSWFKVVRRVQGVLKAVAFLLFLALIAVIAGYKLSHRFRSPVANDVQLKASPSPVVSASPLVSPSPTPKTVTVISPQPRVVTAKLTPTMKKKMTVVARKKTVTSIVKYGKGVKFAKYTVKRGDTLWGITTHRYGSTVTWQRTYRDNRQAIGGNPHRIYPGTVLHLRR
jgi:nucleoid-associated protein YgaU